MHMANVLPANTDIRMVSYKYENSPTNLKNIEKLLLCATHRGIETNGAICYRTFLRPNEFQCNWIISHACASSFASVAAVIVWLLHICLLIVYRPISHRQIQLQTHKLQMQLSSWLPCSEGDSIATYIQEPLRSNIP